MDTHSEERRMLAASVAAFTKNIDGPQLARANLDAHLDANLDAHLAPERKLWRQMAQQGWLGILVPDDAGGLGLGVAELAIVAEGLGRACVPEPLAAVGFAQSVVTASGDCAVRRELLASSMAGDKTPAVAWQARMDDLDPAAAGDAVVAAGDRTTVSGSRVLVQPCDADEFIVSLPEADGPAIYRLSRNSPGVTVERRQQADGTAVATVRMDGVALNDDQRLAGGEQARNALESGLCVGAILASAELLGLCDRLLAQTIDYLGTRQQFGSPLSGFQALRHRVVDLYMQCELIRAALRGALRAFEQPSDLATRQRGASRAKARAGDAARLIAREAVQLHGAIGYTEEGGVGVALRRILMLSAWLGNDRWHRRRYARLTRGVL